MARKQLIDAAMDIVVNIDAAHADARVGGGRFAKPLLLESTRAATCWFMMLTRRNVLDYITQDCEARLRGQAAPSLLPQALLVNASAVAA